MREAPRLDPGIAVAPPRPRHVLLVNPLHAKDPHASFGKHVQTPSLALTSLAGATPRHWTVAYWDENLLQGPPPGDPVPEVVGITVHLTFARRACELAAWYRARGALQPIYRGSHRAPPYPDLPAPRRDVLPRAAFLTTTSVIATRGCHNRCDFCYLATDGLSMPYQVRDVDQVVDEIRQDRQPYCVFIDNNLGSRPGYLRALCAALRPLEIIWSAAVTIDVTDDPSLVRAMALAGCTGVFVGFESLGDDNLRDAGKRPPRTADYARRVALLHDHGIQVNGSFVLGFDHDRGDVFARTAQGVEDARLECATFHILTPYPGTPLFRRLEAEGRILHHDWDRYDTAHVVFAPRHMSPDELASGYGWCYERLFSHASIWRRRPRDPAAVPPYLAMSYLYKRSNRLWSFLIRHRLTARAWRPIVEMTRRRHLGFRARLERSRLGEPLRASSVVSAGV